LKLMCSQRSASASPRRCPVAAINASTGEAQAFGSLRRRDCWPGVWLLPGHPWSRHPLRPGRQPARQASRRPQSPAAPYGTCRTVLSDRLPRCSYHCCLCASCAACPAVSRRTVRG
jgi:hypothetical protein